MSSDQAYLVLRLAGPLQSWGFESLFNNRNTGLFPSKSAIAGMIVAALGYGRASREETSFLEAFAKMKMLTLRLPRFCDGKELSLSRLTDFHTIKGTRKADGSIKETHLTYRQYLQDATFGVVIEGPSLSIETMAKALQNPCWGLWLGRKACIPSEPVFVGRYDTKKEALDALTEGKAADFFTRQEDADSFEDGEDTLCDVAVSFDPVYKTFAPRRVSVRQRTK